jgi:hypothetical protein
VLGYGLGAIDPGSSGSGGCALGLAHPGGVVVLKNWTATLVRVESPWSRGRELDQAVVEWLRPPTAETQERYKRVAYIEALEARGWMELLE